MTAKKQGNIPYYEEINDYLASLSLEGRTEDSSFYCLRLTAHHKSINYKSPFRRGFYFVGLLTQAEKTTIIYDNTSVSELDSFLILQAPNLVLSFYRDTPTYGYLIYFKPQCFSYFKPSFEKEFPFFSMHHTDFFKIIQAKYLEISPHFEDIFSAYENSGDHKVASLKLLILLYQLKEFILHNDLLMERFATPEQLLLKKFITLINTNYIEKRRVEEYAEMLFVTPNHLSQTIKSISGKNALSYINERITAEAKSLISYTELSIAEIAYQLDFSDPANFGKFFKKQTRLTPLEFRNKR